MSVEATEQVGPIVVWRKDLREGSGGAGRFRGGLGQTIEIEPREGYDLTFNAMFDRIGNPARGRDGGASGAAGAVELADGTELRGKGRQKVPGGSRLVLRLPGGGGYGTPSERPRETVRADLEAGYVTEEQAAEDYRLKLTGRRTCPRNPSFSSPALLGDSCKHVPRHQLETARTLFLPTSRQGGHKLRQREARIFSASRMTCRSFALITAMIDRIEAEPGPDNTAEITISGDFRE